MITGRVIGADVVKSTLIAIPPRVREQMVISVQQAAMHVLRRAKSHYLTGAALKVQTGNLRRSVAVDGPSSSGNEITATVGTNSVYGRFWELGFSGSVSVKGHVRKMASRSQYLAFGKRKGKLDAQGIGFVRAHSRNVQSAPRPFLAPALADSREVIRKTILRGIATALAGGR